MRLLPTIEVAALLGITPRGVLHRARALRLAPAMRLGRACAWNVGQVAQLRAAPRRGHHPRRKEQQ